MALKIKPVQSIAQGQPQTPTGEAIKKIPILGFPVVEDPTVSPSVLGVDLGDGESMSYWKVKYPDEPAGTTVPPQFAITHLKEGGLLPHGKAGDIVLVDSGKEGYSPHVLMFDGENWVQKKASSATVEGTSTGKWKSSEPNLSQVPKTGKLGPFMEAIGAKHLLTPSQIKLMEMDPANIEEHIMGLIKKDFDASIMDSLKKMPVVVATDDVVPVEAVSAMPKTVVSLSEVDAMVVELVDLERRLAEADVPNILKRKEELRKAILAEADAQPNETIKLTCEAGVVEFSAASKEFTLTDKSGLQQLLGTNAFQELAKFSVTDLKKVLSENEIATVGTTAPGKTRTMKIVLSKQPV